MKRVYTRIGDVFVVKLDNRKKYFQYIVNDSTQLNSDVVRAFKKEYSDEMEPEISDIVNDFTDFYAHCIVNLGVK